MDSSVVFTPWVDLAVTHSDPSPFHPRAQAAWTSLHPLGSDQLSSNASFNPILETDRLWPGSQGLVAGMDDGTKPWLMMVLQLGSR